MGAAAALEQVEPGSFDKYTRYLDIAQANLGEARRSSLTEHQHLLSTAP